MDVFVSYAHDDSRSIHPIVTNLQNLGFSIWIDHRIETGQRFAERIVTAIERSHAVLVFLSPASQRSRAVLQEIQIAWELKRTLLPVFLSTTELPASFRYYLTGLQFLDVSRVGESDAVSLIAGALRSHADSTDRELPAHPDGATGGGASREAGSAGFSPSAHHASDEIRYSTVIFCEVLAPTSFGEGSDVEQWYPILRDCDRIFGDVVHRFDGYVARHEGAEMVAYFGYPVAHEDDAERAARAALAIIEALDAETSSAATGKLQVSLRIGIHSGPVVVRRTESGEVQIVGDTVSLAARLRAIAATRTVVVSAATLRLIQHVFIAQALEDQGRAETSEPIVAYRLLRERAVRTPFDEVPPGASTPLIGREHELDLLVDRFVQAREGGGSALLLQGEEGLGKTRLLRAFRDRLVEEPHTWLECRCSAFRTMSAFHPLVDLFVEGLDVNPEESADRRLSAVEKALEPTGIPLHETVPAVARLLSIPLDAKYLAEALSPDAERQRILDSLVTWLFTVSRDQPVIFVVEDLQWIDPSSSEVIERLVEQCPDERLLLLLTARGDAKLPLNLGSSVARLSLNRLTRSQIASLVEATADRILSEATVERIIERSDGVPLFAEEITRSILESPPAAAEHGARSEDESTTMIPATLRASLMARIDRLGKLKGVIQFAAVLGREFSHSLLAAAWDGPTATLENGLRSLLDSDLIHRRGPRHLGLYTFKHALIQETVYRSLLPEHRKQLHARVAQTRVDRFPESAENEPEWVARHYEEAGMIDRAVEYYHRANERAMRTSAHLEGIHHLRRAIAFVTSSPDAQQRRRHELMLQYDLAARLMACKGYAHEETEAAFERVRVLSGDPMEDLELQVRSLSAMAAFHQVRSDLEIARRYGETLLQVAERSKEGTHFLWGHLAVGLPLLWSGNVREAVHHLARAAMLRDQLSVDFRDRTQDPGVLARSHASLALWLLGEPARADEMIASALSLASTLDHPFSLAAAWAFSALLRQWQRDADAAIHAAQQAIEIATIQFFPLWEGIGRVVRGWALVAQNQTEAGTIDIERGVSLLATTGTVVGKPHVMGLLADMERRKGKREEPLEILRQALALSQEKGLHFWDAELHRLVGETRMQGPDPRVDEAEESLRKAMEIAKEQGVKALELRTATSLGHLLEQKGERAEARELAQNVRRHFGEAGTNADLRDVAELLARL
jgi:class 3 adenylate cyclase/tetratricopeptide (TPR) repeat protein